MAIIKAGTYTLNDTLTLLSGAGVTFPVDIVGTNDCNYVATNSSNSTMYYYDLEGSSNRIYMGGWTNQDYRNWIFVSDKTVTDTKAAWLTENSVYTAPSAKYTPLYREDELQESVTLTPTAVQQTAVLDEGKAAVKQVTVEAVQTEEKTVYPKTASQSVTPTEGKFLSKVNITGVQVQNLPTITPSKSTQTFVPDTDYFYEQVIVNPISDEYVIPSGSVEITENGTHDVSGKASVTVNVKTTTVTEVLGYEKSVSGDTVDFELMNELPEATAVNGVRGFIVTTYDSIRELYVTKIECYSDGVLVNEIENSKSGYGFHAVPLNGDIDTIKVTFSQESMGSLTLKILAGDHVLREPASETTMSVSNNIVTITNVQADYSGGIGYNLCLFSNYIG